MWFSKAATLLVFACQAAVVLGLGEKQIVTFPELMTTGHDQQEAFSATSDQSDFILASSHHKYAAPILVDPKDNIAIHIAAHTFADDIKKVTGVKPEVINATAYMAKHHHGKAIIVGSVHSDLIDGVEGSDEVSQSLNGQWESFDVRLVDKPMKGVSAALVVMGSDRVSHLLLSS